MDVLAAHDAKARIIMKEINQTVHFVNKSLSVVDKHTESLNKLVSGLKHSEEVKNTLLDRQRKKQASLNHTLNSLAKMQKSLEHSLGVVTHDRDTLVNQSQLQALQREHLHKIAGALA